MVGLSGTVVRLADEAGRASLVLLSHLLSAEDFEFLGQREGSPVVAPFALLDTVPPQEAEKAAAWERHLLELDSGGGAGAGQRPEYDPPCTPWRSGSPRRPLSCVPLVGW
ncbi:hypothetical protein [Streptomyces bauhiniae]|uniref:hypothetical protein n=1 Tax=Streptomyces bauhiniae TaxID=2340725 RepID=UPI001ABF4A7C|nr:hypothetical protein [Streptomyces bauhiniae]